MWFFPWWHHWKTTIDKFSIFPKTFPRDRNTKERWTYLSWFTARPEISSRLTGKKIKDLEKGNGIVEKLEAQYGFLSVEKLLQSAKVVVLPEHQYMFYSSNSLWKKMTKPYATGFPKCVTRTSTTVWVLSWLCPLRWVVLGFHPHHNQHSPPFWHQLLARVTLSQRFSLKHSKMFRLQNLLRNGWVWRMKTKVLSMELRKIGHNLYTSKPPKIWFVEWMTNVRKFSTLIKASSGLNGWTSFLART